MSAVFSNLEKSAQRPHCMADETVSGEPVSGPKFPVTRESAGNISSFAGKLAEEPMKNVRFLK
jgi:hypothetical protein